MKLKAVLILLLLSLFTSTASADDPTQNDQCPRYGYSYNSFYVELGAAAETPLVPIGLFEMFDDGEKYILGKIPQPVFILDIESDKKIEVPITANYCWYTSIDKITAQKDGYQHVFEVINYDWVYKETNSLISLISVTEG